MCFLQITNTFSYNINYNMHYNANYNAIESSSNLSFLIISMIGPILTFFQKSKRQYIGPLKF